MRMHLWLILAALVGAAGCSHAPAAPQRVEIKVTDNGFEPKIVNVQAGRPVTLVVERLTDQTCATELVMKDRNINLPLPLHQAVEVTFAPGARGDRTYACGMDMYHGTVHVE